MTKEDLTAVVSDVNIMEDDATSWVDSGATKHVCRNKGMFQDYADFVNGVELYVGNSSTEKSHGKGKGKGKGCP